MPRRMSRMARMEIMRPDRTREADARFKDRRGREHYDDGRFAPMRNDTNIEIEGRFRDNRGRERFEDGRFAPINYDHRWDGMERRDGGQMNYGMESRSGDYGRGNYGKNHYPYGPFPVYRERDGMRGGGYDMNQIGFNANREMDQNYGMDAGYRMRNEMEYNHGSRMAGGHASGMEHQLEPLSREKAEQWVRSMKGAAGGPGQHWNMEQAKQIMTRHGYQDDPVEFYVVLNMMKSDYTKAAQKMGVDKEEFYACMADAFLNDEDAQPNKLARYYEYIAKG